MKEYTKKAIIGIWKRYGTNNTMSIKYHCSGHDAHLSIPAKNICIIERDKKANLEFEVEIIDDHYIIKL